MITTLKKNWQNILPAFRKIGIKNNDNEETRLRKSILINTTLMITFAGILWGSFYIIFNEKIAGSFPLVYSILSTINIIILITTQNFRFFRFTQLLLTILLPFLLMITLGGFIKGSVVMLWGLLAPIGALLCDNSRHARYWFFTYIILLIICGIVQPHLGFNNNLPQNVITIFFVVNIGAVSTISFFVLSYFVKQKDFVIELMKKNRELELAYLQQEVMLRQSEKLATLGKLSAGMAHEINNPASAAQRGAEQLYDNILKLQEIQYALGELKLSENQLNSIELINQQIYEKSKIPNDLNPLIRNDIENEMENWLIEKGIPNSWEYASTLVNIGFTKEELLRFSNNFSEKQFPGVIASVSRIFTIHNLIQEIGQGVGRITEIVKALKSYSYLDQAPIQSIDIHEGLNNTLVMLRSKLKNGVTVQRDFATDIPLIQAYGSELNQVWTNIIDNAVDAMNGSGKITIKTYKNENWIVVELKDTGHGIPADIQTKVFDPFFTTKPPGSGTGLGLNISHNIIVQKHKGKITVKSEPGETCFQIKLPIVVKEG
jgi:signal transduction histidine kinase